MSAPMSTVTSATMSAGDRGRWTAVALLLGLLAAAAAPLVAAEESLAVGRRQVCDVTAGDRATYSLVLDAQQVLDVAVDQRGADVTVRLRDPDGTSVLVGDSPTGAVGQERLFWVSELAGPHRLEIGVGPTVGRPACYDLLLEEPRSATAIDHEKAVAQIEMHEALEASTTAKQRALLAAAALRWRQLGEPQMEAAALLEACWAAARAGDPCDELETVVEKGDPVQRAVALERLGQEQFERSHDLAGARESFLAAHEAWRDIHGAGRYQVKAAGYLGTLHDYLGEYAAAFDYLDEALQLSRELEDPRWNARLLNNRGRVSYLLAQYDRAEADLLAALELWQDGQDSERAVTLTLLGYIAVARDDLELARERVERALELRGGDRLGQAVSQVALGWVHYHSDQPALARAAYEAALATFRELGKETWAAMVEHKMGLVAEKSGQAPRAQELYASALATFRRLEFQHGEAEALLGQARIERRLGQLERARATVEQALDIVEELRGRSSSFHLQALYFASKLHFFDFYVDLLMDLHRAHPGAGHDAAAFAASEKARARSLLETLNESGVDLRRGADRELLAREARLRRRLEAQLYQVEHGGAPTRRAREESRYLRRQYDEVRRALSRNHPLYAELSEPRPLDAAQIQERLLDDDTALLEYHLGDERGFLFVVTREELYTFELPARRKIEEAARKVEKWLSQSMRRIYRGQLEDALTHLGVLLLDPAAGVLDRKRLMIVSHGVLQYVPFAVLPLPGSDIPGVLPERLVTRHEIAYLPSASTLAVLRDVLERKRESGQRRAEAEIAVLADPVYNREDVESLGVDQPICGDNYRAARFRPGESGLPRLPCTRREAEAIRDLSQGEKLIAMDFAATKELATSPQLGSYRYLHFATHGQFDSQFPEKSSLVFSLIGPGEEERNGYLFMPDVYRLDLAADLAVLSACQTALGEKIRGEGLVGFTQGFMYAGVPRVLVSLWNVDDPATATLMERFYHHLLEENKSPAAALREAQIHMLESTPWSAPYYWAGFVLQGDVL